jgi:hypothetical protein
MRMKFLRLPSLLLVCSILSSAQHIVPAPVFKAIAAEFSGENAQENDRAIVQYHRIQGSPMMAAVAEKVVLSRLQAWGVESKVEQFPSDGKTLYQTYISPMGWDMRGGELWVEGVGNDKNFQPYRLCRYSDAPMCVSTYSKGGEWSGELVEVGAGTMDADYQGKDVRGKVALASGYAGDVVRQAVLKHGAVGVVIYPEADDRPEHPDMVRYNGIWPRAEELDKTAGGFQISLNQYANLQRLMRQGPVRVHGKIDATLAPGQLTLVHAWIRGSEAPEKEILITAHLDHPKWSANDNASGSADMLEVVRAMNALISSGKLPAPKATLHFMWVPENFGTIAYVTKRLEARACGEWDDPRQSPSDKPYKAGEPCIVANVNMDMVGEDTVKTNSRFYITRTPDAVPGDLNGLMADVLEQTREADLYAPTGTHNYWPAQMAPYAQGSDHDIFLAMGIPSTMVGHDPDWTHHTSEDTVDKTDASEFLRVGVLVSAAAYWAASHAVENPSLDTAFARSEAIREYSQRVAEASFAPESAAKQARTKFDSKVLNALTQDSGVNPIAIYDADHPSKSGPRRLTIGPIYAAAFEPISGDDKKWWDEQSLVFESAAPGGGLPQKPTFPVIRSEAVNFMNGKRDAAAIAGLLSAEYNHDFDAAWVERLVDILAKLGLVKK